jgi:multiple sugar transport system substrate-binding protein
MRQRLGWAKVCAGMVACLLFIAACSPAPKEAAQSESQPLSSPAAGSSGSSAGTGAGTVDLNGLDWNKTDDPGLKGEPLTILVADNDGSLAKLLGKFTEDTDIKLNVLGVDYNSLYPKITTAALSNSSDIDLVEVDTIWAGQFLEGNIVEDLTTVVPADYQARFTKSSLSSVMYNNRLAAMPYYSSTKHFYWNNKLLKDAGYDAPPKTWTEFREMSKALTRKGVYASGWSWKQAEGLMCDFVGMVYSFGGNFFNGDGTLNVNSDGAVKALQYMVDLLQTDKTVDPASLQWSEDDVRKAFAAGKIAMMSNWEGIYPKMNDPAESQVVNQTDVGLLPGEGDVVSAAVTGSEGIGIMKSSKHKQAALAFLKWMSSRVFQEPNLLERGTYPALQELYDDPKVVEADKTGTIQKIMKQFDYGRNRPNGPGYVEWSDILTAEIFKALTLAKKPKDALDDAAKGIEQAIAKAK